MKADSELIIEIFTQAVARPTAEERTHFLDEACQGNPELREQIESLLRVEAPARQFLQPRMENENHPTNVLLIEKHERIGRYKLLQKIGEGGCGVVYLAQQEEPVRRQVALKIIKLGLATRAVIARFEAERQALALIDHPNIAKIFDAGATDADVVGQASRLSSSGRPAREPANAGETPAETGETPVPLSAGRPFFVMELVRGTKITTYCEQNKLSTP